MDCQSIPELCVWDLCEFFPALRILESWLSVYIFGLDSRALVLLKGVLSSPPDNAMRSRCVPCWSRISLPFPSGPFQFSLDSILFPLSSPYPITGTTLSNLLSFIACYLTRPSFCVPDICIFKGVAEGGRFVLPSLLPDCA